MLWFPYVSVPRNYVCFIEQAGVSRRINGGAHGTRKFVPPWDTVREMVNTGLVTIQILQNEQRLYFAEFGSWINFQEAVAVTQVVNPVKAVHDVSYQDRSSGEMLKGLDGAAMLMRTNLEEAVQSFVSHISIEQAVYLTGPNVTEDILGTAPDPKVHSAFAGLTRDTGIALRHIRLSGVTLSPTFAQAVEGLGVEQQRRTNILGFVSKVRRAWRAPLTVADAATLLPLIATLGQSAPQQQQGGQQAQGGRRRRN